MAQLIDGKAISKSLRANIKSEIDQIKLKPSFENFRPGIVVIQVGDRSDSNVYIRNKMRSAEEVGMSPRHVKLPKTISQQELITEIDNLNSDDSVDGMILQLPLDLEEGIEIDSDTVINRIAPEKDIDGLTCQNSGRLAHGDLDGTLVPCTPRGCLHLVKSTGTEIKGKKVVVVGRSKIVGTPAALLFMWHHGTVTICHSRTQNLKDECKSADILIVAIGRAKMIKGDWIKSGAVVIDCGINVLEGQGPGGKNKLVGDVDFDECKEVAGHITPVPGGVGPMTVVMLLRNCLDRAKERKGVTLENGVSNVEIK